MLSPLTERGSYYGYKPRYSGALDVANDLEIHRRTWATGSYMAALHNMAVRHAEWWGVPDAGSVWARLPAVHEALPAIVRSQEALIRIDSLPWASRLLGEVHTRTLLALLDDPSMVLDLLVAATHTLVLEGSDSPPDDRYGETTVCRGPAAYELAGFHSSARWLRGRTPLGMMQTRTYYLEQLAARLDAPVDTCLFDATFDAAMVWRFAVLWPPRIKEHHATLLAQAHAFRTALVEPAMASLQRLHRL